MPQRDSLFYFIGEKSGLAKGDKEKAREMWTKAANFNELDLEFALMRPVALQKLSEVK